MIHSGRWYVTAADSASGEVRTFRLDRIEDVAVRPETFEVPAGFDPAARVLSALAGVPRQHEVSLRIQAPAELIRTRLPASIATVEDIPAGPASGGDGARDGVDAAGDGDGWVRVRLQAERLDWIPAVLAGLDRPFVIEHPKALRDQVRALARRLTGYTEA